MQVSEKTALARQQDLPSPVAVPTRRRQGAAWRPWAIGAVACLFLTRGALHVHHHRHHQADVDLGVLSDDGAKCAQSPVLTPKGNLTDVYQDETKHRIINWLSGSVQIPTECFDVMGPTTGDDMDPRWKVFGDLHAYFERVYPNVYKHMTVEKVNNWALAYELKGSDSSKKPLFLTGHQDVVPVEPSTVGAWTHPPFSGHYDGEYIWGRGSGDDKSGVIGILSALELLLEQGFKPSRSIVVAFGFDEEAGGKGAYYLNEFLTSKYGPDSMYLLVDEGNGISEQYGQAFAGPAVAEKGYLDVEIRTSTPGGHSSVPPEHTGIGILARAITELEANPVPARLTRKNVLYEAYQCFAQAPKFPKQLRETVVKSRKSDRFLKKLEKYMVGLGGASKAGIWTTRAVDLVYGGVKVNALPEQATAVANHRINADSSVEELQAQMTAVLAPIAEEFGISFRSFGKDISINKASPSMLELNVAFNSSLEPAPISPHDTSSVAWNLLAGSAKSTWTTSKRTKGQELVFAPGLAIGNTDTKRYWGLTKNIYRFGYATEKDGFGIHTVDEHIRADAIVEGVRFFQTLILNADEARE